MKEQSFFLRGLLFLLLVIALGHATTVSAQISGSISGRVVNQRDEVVPGATVMVEGAALAISRTTTSNEDGYFTVPNLPVGVYVVTVRVAGFADFKQENIKLDVGGAFNITAQLRVGGANETITITDEVYQTVNRETA